MGKVNHYKIMILGRKILESPLGLVQLKIELPQRLNLPEDPGINDIGGSSVFHYRIENVCYIVIRNICVPEPQTPEKLRKRMKDVIEVFNPDWLLVHVTAIGEELGSTWNSLTALSETNIDRGKVLVFASKYENCVEVNKQGYEFLHTHYSAKKFFDYFMPELKRRTGLVK